MMNTRRTKLSMVRDDSQSSKTSNKKCPVVLHGDLIYNRRGTTMYLQLQFIQVINVHYIIYVVYGYQCWN